MNTGEPSVVDEVTDFISNLLPRKRILPVEILRIATDTLTDIHARAKSVYPDCFVGAKISVVRNIAEKVKLSQQYDYRHRKDPLKSFAHFLYKEMTPNVANEFIVDTSGSATVTYSERTANGFDVKVSSKIKDVTRSEVDITIGHTAKEGTGSISISAEDMFPASLRIVAQYLYNVSEKVCFGVEMSTLPLSGSARPDFALSARYTPPNISLSATVGKSGFQICFYKKFTHNVKFATVIDYGNYTDKTTLSLAIQNDIAKDMKLKVFVDSNQTGGFTFEKDVYVQESNVDIKVMRIVGSTLMDRRRRVEFGIGFFIDL